MNYYLKTDPMKKLRKNLVFDAKVDENFCLHSVTTVIKITAITILTTATTKTTMTTITYHYKN